MKYAIAMICALMGQAVFADPVVVFAAASLKEPLDTLAAELGNVVVSYGGSGTLSRQVLAGAPADIVLLANEDWMTPLLAAGIIADVHDFASNSLVVLGAAGSPDLALSALPDALGDGRLAMGAAASVPAGIYGKAALETLGLWDDLRDRLVEVDNVRAGVVMLARGEVPYALAYDTDARASGAVRVVATFPEGSYPAIRYLGGIINATPQAQAFWAALRGPEGQDILQAAGFTQARP